MVTDSGATGRAAEEIADARARRPRRRSDATPARAPPTEADLDTAQLRRLLAALNAMRDGNFRKRLPVSGEGLVADLAIAYNEIAERQQHILSELTRVQRVAGREGRHSERLAARPGRGRLGEVRRGRQQPGHRPGASHRRVRPGGRGGLRRRPDPADGPAARRPVAARRAAAGRPQRERARGPAVVDRRRDHPGDPGGRHRGQARRPGAGPRRRRQLARPDRRGEHDVVPADRPGARHRAGHDRRRRRRPVPHRHRRGVRGDGPAQGHRRPDGRPAVLVRLRGDPRGPRGRHRGPARRPGRRPRGVRAPGRTSPTRST